MTATGVVFLGKVPPGKRYEIEDGRVRAGGRTYGIALRHHRERRGAMTHAREPGGDRTVCGWGIDPVGGWGDWEPGWNVLTCHRCVGVLVRQDEAEARKRR